MATEKSRAYEKKKRAINRLVSLRIKKPVTVFVSVRLNPAELSQLEDFAEKTGSTRSQALRAAVGIAAGLLFPAAIELSKQDLREDTGK